MNGPVQPAPRLGPMIHMDTPLRDLIGMSLVVTGDLTGSAMKPLAVVVDRGLLTGSADLRCATLGDPADPRPARVPQSTTLGDALEERLGYRATHAMQVHGVQFAHTETLNRGLVVGGSITAPLVAFFFAALTGSSAVAAILIGALLAMAAAVALLGRRRYPTAVLSPVNRPMPLGEVLRRMHHLPAPPARRAPAALPGPHPPPPGTPDQHPLVRVAPTAAAVTARIDGLKETYGALLSDVVYRIENSAMFDNAVPLTRDFQVLLMRWDDEQDSLPAIERGTLARQLELAFDTARDHAETVGLAHLPSTARPDGERAAKAARLAARATNDGERAAALEQVTRLLSSLALYYLPRPDEAPKMLGGTPPPLAAP